jgi:hypothetical protein
MAVAWVAVSVSTFPVPAVDRPWNVAVATWANFPKLTAFEAMVAAKLDVPEPVTSPVKVIVWSPVFVPARFRALILSENVFAPAIVWAIAVRTPPNDPFAGCRVKVDPEMENSHH